MSTLRIIRQLPLNLSPTVSGISWGNEDRYVDYLITGTADDVPDDAIYAAMLDDFGNYSELLAPPIDLLFTHHFAGWDPSTFPVPQL